LSRRVSRTTQQRSAASAVPFGWDLSEPPETVTNQREPQESTTNDQQRGPFLPYSGGTRIDASREDKPGREVTVLHRQKSGKNALRPGLQACHAFRRPTTRWTFLAVAAAIRYDHTTGAPVLRPLVAYDH
jgi:hypothetical protein